MLITSCDEEPVTPGNNALVPDGAVLVINEGTFTFGNASLSIYLPDKDSTILNVFQSVNGRPLGDVAQSVTVIDSLAYVVVNNSGNIEVVSINTLQSVATITGLPSPRYMLPLGDGRAYVTNFTGEEISIVDLATNAKTDAIADSGWTEDLLLLNNTVFVCNEDSNTIDVINPQNDQIEQRIRVVKQPHNIVEDANGKLWVLCGGGVNSSDWVNPALIQIDPATRQITQTFTFPEIADEPIELHINASGDVLYFLNGGLFRMNINDGALPATAFVSSGGRNYYSLGVNADQQIYLGDAIDFVQQGWVYRYTVNGALIDSFQSGIIPGEFFFK